MSVDAGFPDAPNELCEDVLSLAGWNGALHAPSTPSAGGCLPKAVVTQPLGHKPLHGDLRHARQLLLILHLHYSPWGRHDVHLFLRELQSEDGIACFSLTLGGVTLIGKDTRKTCKSCSGCPIGHLLLQVTPGPSAQKKHSLYRALAAIAIREHSPGYNRGWRVGHTMRPCELTPKKGGSPKRFVQPW